ncbi:MarR family winged helix-turn-helix transcriptional regulator [Halobacillus sp. Marseille-Q1614]|uniref:MarR family winged helix-turn-helix transcriptional regulator n=1 Tax=Halobacillus sp. Marseille-Q1614 TaxID=2709134 RepID=UPI00156EA5E7|nr:MarR family transcriptional regulator [Halobacillus sp. Marseille-Q1614]
MSLVFHHLQQLARSVNQYLNQALKDEDIYMSHWAVIFQLHQYDQLTQKELKEKLNIEGPPLSRTIKRLEELGYVSKKSHEDKRTHALMLTEKGKSSYSRWEAAIQTAENELIQKFGEENKQELDCYIRKFSSVVSGRKTEL